jgi:hypothetical protein
VWRPSDREAVLEEGAVSAVCGAEAAAASVGAEGGLAFAAGRAGVTVRWCEAAAVPEEGVLVAVRIRATGRIVCAATHGPKPDDTYIDDYLHYSLSVEKRVLVTEPMA